MCWNLGGSIGGSVEEPWGTHEDQLRDEVSEATAGATPKDDP